MATIEQMQQALVNADKAGDTASATALAQALKQAQGTMASPKSDRAVPSAGFDQANAPPSQAHTGSFLPVSRDDQGGLHFDPNAGIFGAAIDAFKLPGDVYSGKTQLPTSSVPGSPDAMGRIANFSTFATPVNPAFRAGEAAIPGETQWMRPVKPATPTQSELKATGGAGFDSARGMGVAYSTDSIGRLAQTTQQDLMQAGLGPVVAEKTNKVLDALTRPPNDPTAQFDYTSGVEATKNTLQSIAQDFNNPKDQLAAQRAIAALDEFVRKPDPSSVVAGPATALGAVKDAANANYSAYFRSKALTDIYDKSQRRADASGSGLNIDNSIRGRVASFLDKPANLSGLTPAEIANLEAVVKGSATTNTLRWAANYLGGGGGLGAALTGFGATALTSDPRLLLAGVPVAVGLAAKVAENSATKRALLAAAIATRQRSPLYADRAASPGMEPLTPAFRAALARGVGAYAAAPPTGWQTTTPAPSQYHLDANGRVVDAQGRPTA